MRLENRFAEHCLQCNTGQLIVHLDAVGPSYVIYECGALIIRERSGREYAGRGCGEKAERAA